MDAGVNKGINKTLSVEFNIELIKIDNTVKLIDEGNTVPFIARYRKEMTGSLDDQVIREIYERLIYLRNLEEKREQVTKLIIEQDKMTDEILVQIKNAVSMAGLDDIYKPFRPKKRTRAIIAKERGLLPLAELIWQQSLKKPIESYAEAYIDPERDVHSVSDAVSGACDIIAEDIADNAIYKSIIKKSVYENGYIIAKAENHEIKSIYETYYDYQEPVGKIAEHRVLAINRGESEKYIKVKIEAPDEEIISKINLLINKNNEFTKELIYKTLQDAYKRLIEPSIEREIRGDLTDKSETSSVKVFAKNLKQLLMQPPVKDKVILAVDPGYRTGCKIAVIDKTGKVLDTGIIYCTIQKNTGEAKKVLLDLIHKYKVDVIAIGNGTGSRETEVFINELISEENLLINHTIVNEAGASIYSASKTAAEEFPFYDVSIRSAVSIGRRIQDPLAELVKIEPKNIGVGQYQHDMNNKRLSTALVGVVENCVNNVGVDINTASVSLLSYVSGITKPIAKNIVERRETKGVFKTRNDLLSVNKLGVKTYEQCAGFLRVYGSADPLDETGVHPESYMAAKKLITKIGYDLENIRKRKTNEIKKRIDNISKLADELGIGAPTLNDIILELEKPGRDPRELMPHPLLRNEVLSIDDLQIDMVLPGTVRNVIDFGVFIDIGVHRDGLVHISQMSDKFVRHPIDICSIGDIVKVKVIAVDHERKKISLSMVGIGN